MNEMTDQELQDTARKVADVFEELGCLHDPKIHQNRLGCWADPKTARNVEHAMDKAVARLGVRKGQKLNFSFLLLPDGSVEVTARRHRFWQPKRITIGTENNTDG